MSKCFDWKNCFLLEINFNDIGLKKKAYALPPFDIRPCNRLIKYFNDKLILHHHIILTYIKQYNTADKVARTCKEKTFLCGFKFLIGGCWSNIRFLVTAWIDKVRWTSCAKSERRLRSSSMQLKLKEKYFIRTDKVDGKGVIWCLILTIYNIRKTSHN